MLVLTFGTADYTVTRLPNTYSVTVEANIVNKQYTVYQREVYDGVNDRAKLAVENEAGALTHIIELPEAGIKITWTGSQCVAARELQPFIVNITSRRLYKSNEFLGSHSSDTYIGPSEARGIQTERFLRNGSSFVLDYSLVFEYASNSWLEKMRIGEDDVATPVRATLDGVNYLDGHTFFHVYDFFDYVASVDASEFTLPFPIDFDDADRPGTCNATALADDPVARAALLALPVQSTPSSSKNKSTQTNVNAIVIFFFIGLAIGLVATGLVMFCGRFSRRASSASKHVELAIPGGTALHADKHTTDLQPLSAASNQAAAV